MLVVSLEARTTEAEMAALIDKTDVNLRTMNASVSLNIPSNIPLLMSYKRPG